MRKPITIGLIGAGFIAHIHARAYQRLSDLGVRLGAVTSASAAHAHAFAREFEVGVVCADAYELLARPDVDVVDLCVPNDLHAPLAIAAARAGKHVICEKPLTGYFGGLEAGDPVGATPKRLMRQAAVATGEEMVAAADAHGVRLMYAENWVYAPALQKAARLAAAAGGTILEMRGQECHSGSHAAYAKEWKQAGGGALIRLGAHPLGGVIYLKQAEGLRRTGRPIRVRSVMAETSDLSRVPSFQAEERKWLVTGWHDVENWSATIVTFEDGTHAVVHAADTVLGGMVDRLEIFMSNGRISCDMTHSGLIRAYAPDPSVYEDEYIAEKLETKAGWSYPSFDEEWMLGYPQELRDFIEAIVEDRPPLSDGRLGPGGVARHLCGLPVGRRGQESRAVRGQESYLSRAGGGFGDRVRRITFSQSLCGGIQPPDGQAVPAEEGLRPGRGRRSHQAHPDQATLLQEVPHVPRPQGGQHRLRGPAAGPGRGRPADRGDQGAGARPDPLCQHHPRGGGPGELGTCWRKAMEDAGADLIEPNFICPNLSLTAQQLGQDSTSQGGAITGQDPELAREVVRIIKSAVKIPVIPKLTPNVTDIPGIAEACARGRRGRPLPGRARSSACRPVDLYNLDHVYDLSRGRQLRQPGRASLPASGLCHGGPGGQARRRPHRGRRRHHELAALRPVHAVGRAPGDGLHLAHVVRLRADPQDAVGPGALHARDGLDVVR